MAAVVAPATAASAARTAAGGLSAALGGRVCRGGVRRGVGGAAGLPGPGGEIAGLVGPGAVLERGLSPVVGFTRITVMLRRWKTTTSSP
jgi:hypothetical protein